MDGSEATYHNHIVGGILDHLEELQDEPRGSLWVGIVFRGRVGPPVACLHPLGCHGESMGERGWFATK
jgi:hypothetical protein